MRNLVKTQEPDVLFKNKVQWLEDYTLDKSNAYKKYKYRHVDIKSQLKIETGHKCVYCESKIGHNTPGDIEHKVPSSKVINLHFDWNNFTIACNECNRRKNDYYEIGNEFLDPYSDDVEATLEHQGPLIYWQSNNQRAEITIRILELNNLKRQALIERKVAKIEEFSNLLERFLSQTNLMLKQLLWKQIEEMTKISEEYSAMLLTIIDRKGITSAST